ncbi:MAG: DUF3006 domain-containing protein [Lachnospiraceae bacterium]|nr:DUF3006 domain-containing protein [Lachnospiraceae bacterium]
MFEECFYIVDKLDGDYAYLVKEDEPEAEPKLVARALLPSEINEGTRLKYSCLQYSSE